MRKTIQIMLITVLLCSTLVNSGFAEDVYISDLDTSSSYAKGSIVALLESNVIGGDDKGNFNPHKPVTRSEMIKMIVSALDIDTNIALDNETFKDVPKDHWANKYIEAAYKTGIVRGISENEFGINEKCTREQMAAIFIRALGLTQSIDLQNKELKNISDFIDEENVANWAKYEVETALSTGLMNGVGSNVFSPKGYAKREQVAVVINRFIKNKEKILEEVNRDTEFEKEIQIYFNGDKINLDIKPVVENEVILVPIDFFDKYLFASLYPSYFEKSNTVFIERPDSPPNGEYKSITMKAGMKNAYQNTSRNPYENESEFKEKLIVLEASPKKVDETILVPLKQLGEFFGMEYVFDELDNIVYLKDANTHKYPYLYFTLKNYFYYPYKGEISSDMNLHIHGRETDDYLNINYDLDYKFNEENFNSVINLSIKGSDLDQKDIEENYEVVFLDKVLYVKDFESNKWFMYETDGITEDDSEDQGIVMDKVFYTNFDDYSSYILNEGKVELDGLTVNKYVVELNKDQIIVLLPEENYEYLEEIINQTSYEDIKYLIEIYVNDQHEIVKEVFDFKGVIQDETEKIDLKFLQNIYFENIGKEIEIKAPRESEIQDTY